MGGRGSVRGHGPRGSGLIVLLQIMLCLIQLPSASLGMSGASQVGIKTELLHREHVSSPLRSEEGLSDREMVHRQVRRSMDRVRGLTKRSLADIAPGSPSSFETNLTDGAPEEYLLSMSVGTPPQKFMVIADTGSDLPWLQCAPCKGCFKQSDPVFNSSRSSTYKVLPCLSAGCASLILETSGQSFGVLSCHKGCQFDYKYGDGSNTSGTFSSDTLNLMSVQGVNFPVSDFWFGCSHRSISTVGSFSSSDGLFGLGQGLTSLPSQLSNPQSGIGLEDRFSYCLVNTSLATVQSSRFVFGHDALLDNMTLQYTPLLNNNVFYYVSLEGITVNNIAVNVSAADLALNSTTGRSGTFFDSGTTFTSLVPAAYDPLLLLVIAQTPASLPRVNGSLFDLCYNVSLDSDDIFPKISFKFANASWDLSTENAWAASQIDAEILEICLALTNAGAGGTNVIGNYQQHDFHVLYDRVVRRIGFVKTDCAAVGR